MKLLPFLTLTLVLAACSSKDNSLIGSWKADKVNVQFDEHRTTPELVRQIGELERQSSFSIGTDSILKFKGIDEQWEERVSISDDGNLCCNGKTFGRWIDGQIISHNDSPIGEIVVVYKKD